ncbi:MAG: alpha/beta fold hydrolase [Actinobacteria bacterium]|jgi:pimeloyl-ACP methyl ester carboxylesterase|nr:alpha/beta fold hydrolase [Actinomycetota bacterium]
MKDTGYTHRTGFVAGSSPVYFEELIPSTDIRAAVVMIHGGAHSGACFMTTPDNRSGWAYDFLRRGYRVIVPDWPGIGRSGYINTDELDADRVVAGLGNLIDFVGIPVILLVHSMSGPFGFALVELKRSLITSLVAVAPGPPGNIQPVPKIIYQDQEMIEVQGVALRWAIKKSGLIPPSDKLIFEKLIGSSTRFPVQAIDNYKASLLALPSGLLCQRQNVMGSQLKVKDGSAFEDFPVLIITGSNDTDHPRLADAETASWLASLGAKITFKFLSDANIGGNGHMLMLEDNSTETAGIILDWLDGGGKE